MAKFPMDLSKFKKVSSDGQTSILKHPDGHEIKIFHGKLSPHLKGQIEKLPMVDAPKMMAEGGDPLDPSNSSQMPEQVPQSEQIDETLQSLPPPPVLSPAQKVGQFVGKNVVAPTVQGVKDAVGGAGYLASQLGQLGSGVVSGAVGQNAAASDIPVTSQVDSSNYNIAPPEKAPDASQDSLNPVPMMQAGIGQKLQGLQQESQAQGELGKQESGIYGANIKDVQASMNDYHQARAKLDQEVASTVKDVQDQHINPNHYMENMTAGQKVRTAIGLILGGIGGGMTHQENPAMKFLNEQIQRDVDAQKANLGKKSTLLSAFYHQYGNIQDATNMALASRSAIVQNELAQAAATAKDPMAKARLMQAQGDLNLQYGPAIARTAATQTLINGHGTNPALAAYLPPDLQERAVPTPFGLKLAASKQDAEESRKTFSGLMELNDKLEKAKQIARSGAMLPGSSSAAYADSLSKDIAQSIGNLHGLSRMSDVDLGLWAKQAPSLVSSSILPGGQARSLAKIKEIQDTIRNKMNEEGKFRIMGWPSAGMMAGSGSVATPPNFPGKAASPRYASTH